MDFAALLADPNFQKYLGNAGQTIGNGGSVGQALNPSGFIEARQTQQAAAPILEQILSGINPTPKGAEGPDSVVTKKTADGTTITVNSPSKENLSSFGTSVPLEAQAKAPTVSPASTENSSPFFKALLGQ